MRINVSNVTSVVYNLHEIVFWRYTKELTVGRNFTTVTYVVHSFHGIIAYGDT